VVCARGRDCPSWVVSEFPTDYIRGTGCEVVQLIEDVEEPAASDRTDGK
jgi:hypothetical protein